MTTHTLCFRSLIKILQTFGLDEEDFQNGGTFFFQQGTADVLLLRIELDLACSPLVLPIAYRSIFLI